MRDDRRRLHSEMSSSDGVAVRAGLSLWLCIQSSWVWGTLGIHACRKVTTVVGVLSCVLMCKHRRKRRKRCLVAAFVCILAPDEDEVQQQQQHRAALCIASHPSTLLPLSVSVPSCAVCPLLATLLCVCVCPSCVFLGRTGLFVFAFICVCLFVCGSALPISASEKVMVFPFCLSAVVR